MCFTLLKRESCLLVVPGRYIFSYSIALCIVFISVLLELGTLGPRISSFRSLPSYHHHRHHHFPPFSLRKNLSARIMAKPTIKSSSCRRERELQALDVCFFPLLVIPSLRLFLFSSSPLTLHIFLFFRMLETSLPSFIWLFSEACNFAIHAGRWCQQDRKMDIFSLVFLSFQEA